MRDAALLLAWTAACLRGASDGDAAQVRRRCGAGRLSCVAGAHQPIGHALRCSARGHGPSWSRAELVTGIYGRLTAPDDRPPVIGGVLDSPPCVLAGAISEPLAARSRREGETRDRLRGWHVTQAEGQTRDTG